MKFSTLAALSSCALVAIAQPVANDKRAVVYETYVTEVVQTEYQYVTVWVTPGQDLVQEAQTTSSPSQHNHEDYHSSLKLSSSSVTPAEAQDSVTPVSVTPVSVTPVSFTAESVTPVSVTPVSVTPVSVTPVSVTPAEASVTPVSVTPASVTPVSVTPVSVTPVEVSVTPVSVTPVSVTPVSVTPVTEQPAPTSTAATNNYGTSSGGACGEIGGQCTGDATFYDVSPGDWTACGTHVDGLHEDIFAIAAGENRSRAFTQEKTMFALFTNTQNADMMPGNANTSPQCGRKAKITYNGKTVTGTLVDKCPGCVSPPHLLHTSLDGLLSP